MKTKLTLSIDKDLVQFAHNQAHSTGKSISDIFSEFLLARKATLTHQESPKISSMIGSLKAYPINDSKLAIHQLYAKKYSH